MLVLSRHRDERIVINGNITITVVEIRGDKVRLGIDAPKEIPVHRQEVADAIARHAAGQSPPTAGIDVQVSGVHSTIAPGVAGVPHPGQD